MKDMKYENQVSDNETKKRSKMGVVKYAGCALCAAAIVGGAGLVYAETTTDYTKELSPVTVITGSLDWQQRKLEEDGYTSELIYYLPAGYQYASYTEADGSLFEFGYLHDDGTTLELEHDKVIYTDDQDKSGEKLYYAYPKASLVVYDENGNYVNSINDLPERVLK